MNRAVEQYTSSTQKNDDLMGLNKDPVSRYMIAQYVKSINDADNSQELAKNAPQNQPQQQMNDPAMGQNPLQAMISQYMNQGA